MRSFLSWQNWLFHTQNFVRTNSIAQFWDGTLINGDCRLQCPPYKNGGRDSSGINDYNQQFEWLESKYVYSTCMNGYEKELGQALVPYPSVAVDRLMYTLTPSNTVKIRRGR